VLSGGVCVTLPAALHAVILAVFLAIARVAGETAPLLLTAGWNTYWPRWPNDFTPSLPYFIFNYAISPYDDWHRQAWAAALVLLPPSCPTTSASGPWPASA
jgi:phosphate transport system permease protein